MKEEVRRVTLRAFEKLPLAPCIDSFLRDQQEQVKQMRVGDAIGLALLLEAPILVSKEYLAFLLGESACVYLP